MRGPENGAKRPPLRSGPVSFGNSCASFSSLTVDGTSPPRGVAMPRRFATIAAFMSVLALSIPAAAQVTRDRDPNPALWQSTPDAAALGPAGRGFLEFGHTDWDGDWLASAGLGVKGGMLHFTYGQSDLYRDYALGYARRIVEHSLGVFGSWGTGIDFTGAHQTGPGPFGDATAARLTIPLS